MDNPPDLSPKRVMRIDWTITMGDILTMVGALVVACAAYTDYRLTMDRHEVRITANEASINGMRAQQSDQLKYQTETTRAIDRLTWAVQAKPQ